MFVLFVQGNHTFGGKTPTHHLCLIIFADISWQMVSAPRALCLISAIYANSDWHWGL